MTNTSLPRAEQLLESPLSKNRQHGSLQKQLHQRLKSAVLSRSIQVGVRLPSSRELAKALGISRNTVTSVYERLAAEGYLVRDPGGTRVSAHTPMRPSSLTWSSASSPLTAKRITHIHSIPCGPSEEAHFHPGVPSLSNFPLASWRRSLERAITHAGLSSLNYGDPLGQLELRTAIARHWGIKRGVVCDPAQVVITEGATEALNLCVRLLTNSGDVAWMEDPGYRGAKMAMRAGDLQIHPMQVDEEGLVATEQDWNNRPPRLIYTTPSHQYPSGGALSLARRLDLIANASRHGAWVIEDDYDCEFWYAGNPIPAMHGLVPGAPVIYIDTFSKTMFPSLRLGFMVLPQRLVPHLTAPLKEMLRGGHRHEQLALSDFIERGEFSRHLTRMKKLYWDKQLALRSALARHIRAPHQLSAGTSGLHLAMHLPADCSDKKIVAQLTARKIAPLPLSALTMSETHGGNGLIIGYGSTSVDMFDPLARVLSQAIDAS